MRTTVSLALCVLLALAASALGALKIEGPPSHRRDSLVELRATGVPEGGAVLWDVFPEGAATLKEDGAWIVLNGPPGTYSVRAMSISVKDGKVVVERARHTLKIEGEQPPPAPPVPPVPPTPPTPPTPPPPAPGSPLAALVQIRFGTAGCTATIIGGLGRKKQLVLTAAHCISAVGQSGTAKLKDGRSFAVKVVSLNRTSDVAWLEMDSGTEAVPLAYLADEEPAVGVRVWHSGYGVDKPGNREDGTVLARPNGQGQLAYRLSASPGDSGGGIITDATGKVLSPVCCTTCLGCMGTVYGGSVAAVRAALPPAVAEEDREGREAREEKVSAGPRPRGLPAPLPAPLPPVRPARLADGPLASPASHSPHGKPGEKLTHPVLRVVPEERRPEGAKHVQLYYPVRDLGPLPVD